ncbi:hypothetical protein MMC22_003896 [Lobaria immixta]|nr:hypothetical protein [Lobaria immixta]
MDAPLFRLTFGVELEFMVNFNPADYEDQLEDAKNIFLDLSFIPTLRQKFGILVRLHMIEILNENGFDTNVYEVFYCYHAPALNQIEMVVELLSSIFGLFINDSCGLHVHVGNESRGLNLLILKSFCSLITSFDRQLDSLHPDYRLRTRFARSTRMAFMPSATFTEKLAVIGRLTTVEGLIYQFHATYDGDYDKNMAFSFFNPQENHDKPLRTIEFRRHRGTLDPELIITWAKVACGLVDRPYTDRGSIRDLINMHTHDSRDYTVIDLFIDLKLRDLAKFYEPRVFAQYGTDQNLPVENEEPELIDSSSWYDESDPVPCS